MDQTPASEQTNLLDKVRGDAPKPSFRQALAALAPFAKDYSILLTMLTLADFSFIVMLTIFPLYMTSQWDFSDWLAGLALGNFGLMVGVLSVFTGVLPTKVGAKPALCLASLAVAGGMVVIGLGPKLLFVMLSLYTLVAGGTSLLDPIIICLTQFYAPAEARLVTNTLFAGAYCASYLLTSIVISVFWDLFNDDQWAYVGIYGFAGILAVVSSILAFTLGKPQFTQATGEETTAVSFREASKHPTFLKFLGHLMLLTLNNGFSGVFITALPLYMLRELGDDSDWATVLFIISLSSLITVVGLSSLVFHVKNYDLIAYGCLIQSFCPAALILPVTYLKCAAAGVIFGIGNVYIPRVYDYICEVAPPKHEAIYLSLSNIPGKGSLFMKAVLSGCLLSVFLPEDGESQGWLMWLIIFAGSFLTALMFFIFRKHLELSREEEVDAP